MGCKNGDLLTRRLATQIVNSTSPSILGGIGGFWSAEVMSWNIDGFISEVVRKDAEKRDTP